MSHFFKILLFCLPLLSAALGQAQVDSQETPEWNQTNLMALASLGCGMYANKSETIPFTEQLLFHELYLNQNAKTGDISVTGECGKSLDANLVPQSGALFKFEIKMADFEKQQDPVLMGLVGDWGFRFYFKSLTKFDGQNIKVVKVLERISFFHAGTSASQSLIGVIGLLDLVWSGAESLSPIKYGMSGHWQTADQSLNLLGIGERNVEALSLWSNQGQILINSAGLVGYWGRGEGRPTGDRGDAIFFKKYGSSNLVWMGCSYFVEKQHKPIDEALCRRLSSPFP